MQPTQDELRQFVVTNPGQGTFDEYARVLETIVRRAPAKLLIFGVGRDSALWLRANAGGRTVFVEHEPTWIQATRERLPAAEIIPVTYRTARWQWRLLLPLGRWLFMRDLPGHVVEERWDIIFVDSPQGGKWTRPGRMQSLCTAATLAQRFGDVDVLAHDCDRRVEQAYCDRYLKDEELVAEIDTLRHYRVASRPS